jgi:hypothetical protein
VYAAAASGRTWLDGDGAVVAFHDRLREGQAQAAAVGERARGRAPVEPIEDERALQ